ncbi:hypothetical protein P9112_001799 [Eukaryota sp. TZLM1-RC]
MLPDQYDIVIVGTSPTNTYLSYVAAAHGKSVLVLDPTNTYGSWSSTHSLSTLQTRLDDCSLEGKLFHNFRLHTSNLPEDFAMRKTMVDLIPLLHPTNSTSISYITASGLTPYMAFQNPGELGVLVDDVVTRVPLTKSDVFREKSLGPRQKRQLVKYIQSACQSDDITDDVIDCSDLPHSANIALTHLLPYLCPFSAFFQGLGKFGVSSGILINKFGSSEISQANSRLCCVFGGIYLLNSKVLNIDKSDKCLEIESEFSDVPGVIKYDWLINDLVSDPEKSLSVNSLIGRMIVISKEKLPMNFVCLFFKEKPVYLLQYTFENSANISKDSYLIYIWAHFSLDEYLDEYLDEVFEYLKNYNFIKPIYVVSYRQNVFENLVDYEEDANILNIVDVPEIPTFDVSFDLAQKSMTFIDSTIEMPFQR